MASLIPAVISSGRILRFNRGKTAPLFSSENNRFRCFSKSAIRSSLEPPDLPRLAETARISLTPTEVEEFAPKIQQVVDWFGQLQSVDLQCIEPAIRADTEGSNWRDDVPKTFENREAIVAAVPNYEDSFIKVPKILNKEWNGFEHTAL